MHEELWLQVEQLDRQKMAQRAKCQYDCDHDCFTITLLNRQYTIVFAEKQVFSVQSDSEPTEAGFLEQLCILAYLINSKQLPLAKKLVKAESLPGGAFFFRGPHVLPIQRVTDVFGANPPLLYRADGLLGAKKRDFGNASLELLLLPRIPLTFVIWGGDDEFEARASILFDQTASEQLPLDALGAAVNLAVDAVITSVDRDC